MTRKFTTMLAAAFLASSVLGGVALAQAPKQIDVQEAIRIALQKVPGTVKEVDSDHERGRSVFEVEIWSKAGPKYEVLVDAVTGEVLEARIDD